MTKRTATTIGLLSFTFILWLAASAFAQASDSGETFANADVKYFDFFVVKGGPIAFGLIALSIVTVALTIEHALTIRRATLVSPESLREASSLIEKKQYVEAIRFTAEDPSMISYVLHAGLTDAPNGFGSMERAIEDALDERSARLFRKIEYVNIIGAVSPMIGLFGTVVGMIMLFAQIHAEDAFPGARIVADKISIALITTFWGLAVAIPAISVYAVFRNRIDVLTAECAIAAEHVLRAFKPGATSQDAADPALPQEHRVGT